MDVTYFLKIRTEFIRFYYSEAVKPFFTIKKLIDEQASPFDNPPYDESGEPAFLEEWMDADLGIEMVGLHCVSLLSETLKIYFETLRTRVLRFKFVDQKREFKNGFVTAYRNALGEKLSIEWQMEGVDFDIIEQIVLARNRANHGDRLSEIKAQHDVDTLRKHAHPFFATEFELKLRDELQNPESTFFLPSVHVSEDRLFQAIGEIEKMAEIIGKRVYVQGDSH